VVATVHLVHANREGLGAAAAEPLLKIFFAGVQDHSAVYLVSMPRRGSVLAKGAAEADGRQPTPVVSCDKVHITLANASGAGALRRSTVQGTSPEDQDQFASERVLASHLLGPMGDSVSSRAPGSKLRLRVGGITSASCLVREGHMRAVSVYLSALPVGEAGGKTLGVLLVTTGRSGMLSTGGGASGLLEDSSGIETWSTARRASADMGSVGTSVAGPAAAAASAQAGVNVIDEATDFHDELGTFARNGAVVSSPAEVLTEQAAKSRVSLPARLVDDQPGAGEGARSHKTPEADASAAGSVSGGPHAFVARAISDGEPEVADIGSPNALWQMPTSVSTGVSAGTAAIETYTEQMEADKSTSALSMDQPVSVSKSSAESKRAAAHVHRQPQPWQSSPLSSFAAETNEHNNPLFQQTMATTEPFGSSHQPIKAQRSTTNGSRSGDFNAFELASAASSSSGLTKVKQGKTIMQKQLMGICKNAIGHKSLALWGHAQSLDSRSYRSVAVSNAMRIIFVLAPLIAVGVVLPTPLLFDPLLQNLGDMYEGLWAAGARIQVAQFIEAATQRMFVRPGLDVEPTLENVLELQQLEAQFSDLSDRLQAVDHRTQDLVAAAAQAAGVDVNAPYAAPVDTSRAALQAQFESDINSQRYWSDHQRWVPIADDTVSGERILTPFEVGQWIQANMRSVVQLDPLDFRNPSPDASVQALLLSGMMQARVWPAFNASVQARTRTLQHYTDSQTSGTTLITVVLACTLMAVIITGVCCDSLQITRAAHAPLLLGSRLSEATTRSIQGKALQRVDELVSSSAGGGGSMDDMDGMGEHLGLGDGGAQSDSDSASDGMDGAGGEGRPLVGGGGARHGGATSPRAHDMHDVDDSGAGMLPGREVSGNSASPKRRRGSQVRSGRGGQYKWRKQQASSVSWGFLVSNCLIVGLAPIITITFAAAITTALVDDALPSVFHGVARTIWMQEVSFHQYASRDFIVEVTLGTPSSAADARNEGALMLQRVSDVLNGAPNGPMGRSVPELPANSAMYRLLLENGCVSPHRWQFNCSTAFDGVAQRGGLIQPLLRMSSMVEEIVRLERASNLTAGQRLIFTEPRVMALIIDIVAIDKRVTRDTIFEVLSVILGDVQTDLQRYSDLLYICAYCNMAFIVAMALVDLRYLFGLHEYLLSTRLVLLFIPERDVIGRSGKYEKSYSRTMLAHVSESL